MYLAALLQFLLSSAVHQRRLLYLIMLLSLCQLVFCFQLAHPKAEATFIYYHVISFMSTRFYLPDTAVSSQLPAAVQRLIHNISILNKTISLYSLLAQNILVFFLYACLYFCFLIEIHQDMLIWYIWQNLLKTTDII